MHPQKTAQERQVEEEVFSTLQPMGRGGRRWVALLASVVALGAAAYAWQLWRGLEVTAMRNEVSWGLYMTNFVFFIGVSHAGTLISAILRVTGAEWRRPITRMAEAITVFALLVGAPMVILDMGRPDRLHHVFLYGRLNSPILWDVCSIATYVCGSIFYLYVALLPDLRLAAEALASHPALAWKRRIYAALSLGYRGTPRQKALLEKALATMAVVIIPVAISVHTVVSWIFGMTLRPGWHSTIFGPYFVVGAIFSGTAAIILAMAIFRKVYGLQNYLGYRQFRNLGTLLLALNLLYIYFTLSEYLTTWYGGLHSDRQLLDILMGQGAHGIAFWLMAVFGLFLPVLLLAFPKGESIGRIVAASALINVGMWVKRYLIIVPTLMAPYLPPEAAGIKPSYFPTWVEWSVTAGALAFFLLLFTLFAKLFPIISVWETQEALAEGKAAEAGIEIRARRTAQAAALLLALAASFLAGSLKAAPPPAVQSRPAPAVSVEAAEEEGQRVLKATVRTPAGPAEGAVVSFFVKRSFGDLLLGQDQTLDDGTAVAPFPDRLPSDGDGRLRIRVSVAESRDFAPASAAAAFPGGLRRVPEGDPFPRALWAPRAPLPLLATIITLLSLVWGTYVFVFIQLYRIRQGGAA